MSDLESVSSSTDIANARQDKLLTHQAIACGTNLLVDEVRGVHLVRE